MSHEDTDQAPDEPADPASAAGSEADETAGAPPEPVSGLPLEEAPDEEDAPPAIAALDVCPNCGAAMSGRDTVVCLRCGFDLARLEKIETEEGEEAAPEPVTPLSRPGAGGVWAPAILAAVGGGVVIVAILSAAQGIFPAPTGDAAPAETVIPWSRRLETLARYPVLLGLWTACGLAGLGAIAWLRARPLGDLRLAAVRVLAATAVASTAACIALPWPIVEFPLEAVAASLAFGVVTAIFFRLGWRDAGMAVGVTIAAFVMLYLLSHLMAWVM
jgi:hypothetical protein